MRFLISEAPLYAFHLKVAAEVVPGLIGFEAYEALGQLGQNEPASE